MQYEQQRWEKGQSILHMDSREKNEVKNSYGVLRYVKNDKKNQSVSGGFDKRNAGGFVFEAYEAPGTPVHTEREKHLKPAQLKKAGFRSEKHLYTNELPLRGQAVFYEITARGSCRKSNELIKCLKAMLAGRGHASLRDAFGFLDQQPERLGRQAILNGLLQEVTLEQFHAAHKQLNAYSERLRKKEAKERQLCSELQLMIDRRKEAEKKEVKGSDLYRHREAEERHTYTAPDRVDADKRYSHAAFSREDVDKSRVDDKSHADVDKRYSHAAFSRVDADRKAFYVNSEYGIRQTAQTEEWGKAARTDPSENADITEEQEQAARLDLSENADTTE